LGFHLCLCLLFFQEQFCIIARRELFELDEEVTQSELEAVDIAVELSKALDEDLNLRAGKLIQMCQEEDGMQTHFCT
jgi:hypothetical protein